MHLHYKLHILEFKLLFKSYESIQFGFMRNISINLDDVQIPTLLAQQNGQNATTSVNTNQSNGCSKPISYYQPCECTDWGDGNIRLDCDDKNLGNAKVSRILKDFLSDPVAAKLRSLWLANNQLTRVPPEIANLIHLQHVDLAYNMIHTIHKGDFNFGPKASGGSLDLRYNELSHIEEGAFQGKF